MNYHWKEFWYEKKGQSKLYGSVPTGYWSFRRRKLYDILTLLAIIILLTLYAIK